MSKTHKRTLEDFFLTDAKNKAFLNNYGYVLKQVMKVMAAVNAHKTRITPDSTQVTIKECRDALIAHQEGISLNSELFDVPKIVEQIKNKIITKEKRKSIKHIKKSIKVSIHKDIPRRPFSAHVDQETIRRKKGLILKILCQDDSL